jgi:hypothetical protein
VTITSGEAAGRGVFLSQAVQGEEDGSRTQLTPNRLWAEAERRIRAPAD